LVAGFRVDRLPNTTLHAAGAKFIGHDVPVRCGGKSGAEYDGMAEMIQAAPRQHQIEGSLGRHRSHFTVMFIAHKSHAGIKTAPGTTAQAWRCGGSSDDRSIAHERNHANTNITRVTNNVSPRHPPR